MSILTKYLAYVLIISAFFRIIPITAAFLYGESPAGFVITFLLSLFLGIALLWLDKRAQSREFSLTLTKGLMLVALSFIILPLIGAISFLPSFDYSILNAVFESVSGFTTTGLTLYTTLEGLPNSLLLWRAETQWMGGIGIIMVFLFILSRLKSHTYMGAVEAETKTTMTLYEAQGFPERLEPGLRKTVTNIMLIYCGYTIVGIILLFIVGMPFFDSIAMTFTSLSTGGFTVRDDFYSNNLQLVVLCALMLIGSISFIAHNKLIQKKFKEFLSAFEKNVFFVMLFIAILLALFVYTDIKVVLFELISSFTTTGYSITNISLLPQLFIMLIMVCMVVGGNIASTAGGIKVFRVYYLVKAIPWLLKKLSSPAGAVVPFKIKDKPVEESDILIVGIFVTCYVLMLLIGTVVFMLHGYNFLDSSFQVTSALGTVGLQTMELISLSWLCKTVLMVAMLLGRLEIFPLLILVRSLFKR